MNERSKPKIEGGIRWGVSWATTIGGREYQQDTFVLRNPGNLVGVFDGLGGEEAGHLFSEKTAALFENLSLKQLFDKKKSLFEIAKEGCSADAEESLVLTFIHLFRDLGKQLHDELGHYKGGTTACVALRVRDAEENPLTMLINIGDSRAYLRLDDEKWELISRDHSNVQLNLDRKTLSFAEAHTAGDSNMINQSMYDESIEPDIYFLRPSSRGVTLSAYLHKHHVGVWGEKEELFLGHSAVSIERSVRIGDDWYASIEKDFTSKDPQLLLTTDGPTDQIIFWLEEDGSSGSENSDDLSMIDQAIPEKLREKSTAFTTEKPLSLLIHFLENHRQEEIKKHGLAKALLEAVYHAINEPGDNATVLIGPAFA